MHVIQRSNIEPFQADDGSLVRELASPANSPLTRHSLAEIRHPVGSASREHYHTVAEEVYLVLQGQGELRLDGQARPVQPGDVVVITPGQRHKISARGAADLVLLVTCAPAYSDQEVIWLE